MTPVRGWKCLICGNRTDTRRYAVLRLVTGSKYVLDASWKHRLVCDDCAAYNTNGILTVAITELRTAKIYEDPYDY